MRPTLSFATIFLLSPAVLGANFSLVQDYSGSNFFSGWDFYGNFDNLTNGDVIYVDQANATSDHLAFMNSAGHAILKVDNTTSVPFNDKRNSVRITTKDYFEVGTIWVFDAVHLPYGCSVWPSFWTKGNDWPNNGEIDIVEGVNKMTFNQMALHTQNGCTQASSTNQKGTTSNTNCTQAAGCTVAENTPNSFGQGFASAGGGVWVTQFDVSGIFIWFWNRANVPAAVSTATNSIDISSLGPPSASYPSSTCNIGNFFGAQQLVLDITLCGDWAGIPSVYQSTCGGDGTANACYVNNVINAGSPTYDNAYFEIGYIRAFAANSSVVVSASGTSNNSSSPSGTSAASGASHSAGAAGQSGNTGSGSQMVHASYTAIMGAGMLAVISCLLW